MRQRGDGGGRSAARAAALPFGFARASRSFTFRDSRRWLSRCAEQEVEQRRLFPWIAVAFGLGILLFFAAEGRPSLWAPAAAGLAAAAAVLARRRLLGFAIAIGFAALFFGFAAGVLRMRAVEAPVLGRTTVAPLAGFIESIEEREAGGRLVLRIHDFAAAPAEQRPRRVRATVRDRQGLKAGDFITANARLCRRPKRPGRAATTSPATRIFAASARSAP
jgi:competence protein ComEC